MNRNDLRRLSRLRLKEARVLLKAECFDGAYYLCGYAVECALKACIAKATKRSEFPDLERVKGSYTHNLTNLVKLAGLEPARVAEVAADAAFSANWVIVKDWSEAARYAEHSEQKARDLYRAVTDGSHGVLRWIRRHW
ncbi:DNA-binding protein [Gemmata sp.]|uniref:DNA-binding protein n=1 Tax=Gemmata sp. TaxID=1914242 RepID=UPI003F70FC8A